jgi:hypothetical protein
LEKATGLAGGIERTRTPAGRDDDATRTNPLAVDSGDADPARAAMLITLRGLNAWALP